MLELGLRLKIDQNSQLEAFRPCSENDLLSCRNFGGIPRIVPWTDELKTVGKRSVSGI